MKPTKILYDPTKATPHKNFRDPRSVVEYGPEHSSIPVDNTGDIHEPKPLDYIPAVDESN
jgi:hypothetical protein